MTRLRRPAAATLALGLTIGAVACGGTERSSTSTRGANAGTPATSDGSHGRKGGALTVLAAADVDYVDPGLTYYVFGLMVSTAVNRQLYTYKPGDRLSATPDLATGPPEISADKKTITVRIRPGVRYAPPVNREVTAADVKYAIERAFSRHVPSSYASIYFKDLVGAPKSPGPIKDIPGVRTPDDHTLVLGLAAPSAVLVSQALAMTITAPVPKEYAAPFDARTPSTYDQYVAFTGPYMIAHDLRTGKLTGRVPGRRISIVRNPNWDPATDFRPAYADTIEISEGNDDATVSSRRILKDDGMIQGDGAPPAQVIKQALSRNEDQISFVPAGANRIVSMNTTIKPFDNVNVRRAVIAAFDRTAMQLTRGGRSSGDVATHFLPPGFPGFEEAGGMKGTGADFLRNPNGDMALATRYMKQAGYPSGRYTGGEKILMVATNADPGKASAEVAARQFEKLGFRLNFRLVPQDTLYTRFCNVPKAKVAICPNVGFSKDFLDPQAMLDPVFNGKNILPANNSNWAQLDDPEVNRRMEEAAKLDPGPARNKAWGEIDRMVTERAAGVPWFWDKQPLIHSKDVDAVPNAYQTTYDLSFTSLR